MKRVLSLVLAFVMVLGMMVPSFADATDKDVTLTLSSKVDNNDKKAVADALVAAINAEDTTVSQDATVKEAVNEDDNVKVTLTADQAVTDGVTITLAKDLKVVGENKVYSIAKTITVETVDSEQEVNVTEVSTQTETAQLVISGVDSLELDADQQKAVKDQVILPESSDDNMIYGDIETEVSATGKITVSYVADEAVANYQVKVNDDFNLTYENNAYALDTQDNTNITLKKAEKKADQEQYVQHEFDNQKLIIALKDEAGAMVLANKGLDAVGFNKDNVRVTKDNDESVTDDKIDVTIGVDKAGYLYITADNEDGEFEDGDYKISLGTQNLTVTEKDSDQEVNYVIKDNDEKVINFTVNDDNEIEEVNDNNYEDMQDVPAIEVETIDSDYYYIKVLGKDNEFIDFGDNANEAVTITLKKWDKDEEEFVDLKSPVSFNLPINKDGNVKLPISKIDDNDDEFMIKGVKYDIGDVFFEVKVNAPAGSGYVNDSDNTYIIDPYRGVHINRVGDDKISVDDPSSGWELKEEGLLATIRVPLEKMNLIVKIYTDGYTGKLREPVEGAEVQLYEVQGFGVINDKNLKEHGKALKTNSEGQVVFKDLRLNEYIQYISDSDLQNQSGNKKKATIEEVAFPYAIKQLSAPEGVKPFSKYITSEGLYAEGLDKESVSDNDSDFIITKSVLNGTDLVVEIHNVTDSLGKDRISGKDRYGTAVAIAEEAYPDGLSRYTENNDRRTVILANGYTFSDALVAGPLARVMSAPILLTDKDSIPEATMNYLKDDGNDNEVEQVVIMGGNNTISEKVVEQLNKEGIEYISRIDGANRFDTAVKTADKIDMLARGTNDGGAGFDRGFTVDEKSGSYMFVANGYTFADALTASTPAARNGIPILLTAEKNLPEETKNAIEEYKIQNVVVVGGDKSVSTQVFSELTSTKANVTRIAGENRTVTAIEVAREWMEDATAAYFASKDDMKASDALTASTLGAVNGMPILLVDKDKVSDELKDYINDSELIEGKIIGGTNSISTEVRDQLDKIFAEK